MAPSDSSPPPIGVLIVGAGFAGLGMAIALARAGRRDFLIVDKDRGLGGTWRVNTYPGCACDVPSHLYSFSFHPNPSWSRAFAEQPEILAYLEDCADRFDLRPHLRLGVEIVEARRDSPGGFWRVRTADGQVLTARHLVLGLGGLSRPALPAIEGLETFEGPAFHTARWRHDLALSGKRVAVIGTGASAIQVVPRIAPEVASLDLYQRTPPWVLPKPDRPFGSLERGLYRHLPALARLQRYLTYWRLESRVLGFTLDPRIMEVARWMGLRHLRRQVPDASLRARLTPDYTPGCKRILMANDYYPALSRPNVALHTDPIAAITPRGVRTADGVERPVDVLIFATGFRVTDILTPLRVIGPGDRDLNAAWTERAEAYLGTMVAGFPNLFVLTGPNTGLGHNSMVFMIEAQTRLILDAIEGLDRRAAWALEVTPEAQAAYNAGLRARLADTVWASGCASWYLDAKGHNATLWPGFTFDFRRRTRAIDPAAFLWHGVDAAHLRATA